MTVTISAVTAGPPAVGITVSASATITAIQLFRTANGITELTTVQPRTGTATVYVEDYQIPWDVDVTYTATYTAGSAHTDTSAPVTVSATAAWAIHPVFPAALSVQIDQQHPVGGTWISSVATVSRTANSTVHQIVGSPYPVITTNGPRQASKLSVAVHTTLPEDEAAIWALVDDQTPIMFRFPDSFEVGFEDGFYSVGDVTCDRVGVATDPARLFTLPLTRVAAPAVTQQLIWDYPSLTAAFTDYAALTAAFADYASLTADRRN